MSTQGVVLQDIFGDADKVEILGKLPVILWAFIEKARSLVRDLDTDPEACAESVKETARILGILESAAGHLGNEQLKACLEDQARMLASLAQGEFTPGQFINSFNEGLPKLEGMAGPRPEALSDGSIDQRVFDRALDKAEQIRKGRSADIVVSVELLDEIRAHLEKEIVAEGIRSVLIVDNAGTLIVNIGDKADLDVVSLAAVAAANFAATEKIAHLIGERDFVLLFYKGHNESFHFTRVGKDYILVTIFDNSLSLGLLRLKISEASQFLVAKLPKREG